MLFARGRVSCRVVAAALSPVLLAPAVGRADEGPAPSDGARVRVTAPGVSRRLFQGDQGKRLVGTIVSQDDETLSIRTGDLRELAVVPRSSIRKLEISRRRSQRAKGLLIGFLVGTAAGIGLTAVSKGSSACDSTHVTGCDVALSALVPGLPAALLGAILAPGEKWEEFGSSPIAVGLAPAPGGGVGISLRWTPSAAARPVLREGSPRAAWAGIGPPPSRSAGRSSR